MRVDPVSEEMEEFRSEKKSELERKEVTETKASSSCLCFTITVLVFLVTLGVIALVGIRFNVSGDSTRNDMRNVAVSTGAKSEEFPGHSNSTEIINRESIQEISAQEISTENTSMLQLATPTNKTAMTANKTAMTAKVMKCFPVKKCLTAVNSTRNSTREKINLNSLMNSTYEKVNSTFDSTMDRVDASMKKMTTEMKTEVKREGFPGVMTWAKNKFQLLDEFVSDIRKISPSSTGGLAALEREIALLDMETEPALYQALADLEKRLVRKGLCRSSEGDSEAARRAGFFNPLCAVQYLATKKKIIGEKYYKIEPNVNSIPASRLQKSTQLQNTVKEMEWKMTATARTAPTATKLRTGKNLEKTPKEKLQARLLDLKMDVMGGSGACLPGNMQTTPQIARKQCYLPSGNGLNVEISWDSKKYLDICFFSANMGSSSMDASAGAEGQCFRMDMDSMPKEAMPQIVEGAKVLL